MKQLLILGSIGLLAISAHAADVHCEGKGSFGKVEFGLVTDLKDDGTEEGLSAKAKSKMPEGTYEYPEEGNTEKTVLKTVVTSEQLAEVLTSLEEEHKNNQELADWVEMNRTNDPNAKAPPVVSTWTLIDASNVESVVLYSIRPSDPIASIRSFTMKDKSVVNILAADFVTPVVCAKAE